MIGGLYGKTLFGFIKTARLLKWVYHLYFHQQWIRVLVALCKLELPVLWTLSHYNTYVVVSKCCFTLHFPHDKSCQIFFFHITTSIGVKLSILWLVGSSLLSLSWWRPLACHLPIFQIHLQSTPKWKSIAVKDIVINFYLRRGINKEDAISFCCIWYIFFRHKYNLIYAFNVLFNYKIMCNN